MHVSTVKKFKIRAKFKHFFNFEKVILVFAAFKDFFSEQQSDLT